MPKAYCFSWVSARHFHGHSCQLQLQKHVQSFCAMTAVMCSVRSPLVYTDISVILQLRCVCLSLGGVEGTVKSLQTLHPWDRRKHQHLPAVCLGSGCSSEPALGIIKREGGRAAFWCCHGRPGSSCPLVSSPGHGTILTCLFWHKTQMSCEEKGRMFINKSKVLPTYS